MALDYSTVFRLADEPFESLRGAMPITRKWAYLDHAAVAPLPQPTAATIAAWIVEAQEEGDTVWPDWAARLEELRGAAAQLIGAVPDEIALVPNTTAGISLVAEGVSWQSGDNVVTLENEFPSNLYPWLNLADRGVEVRRVAVAEGGRVDYSQLAQACDQRTRVVSVSWVGYASGFRLDVDTVADIAHRHGALFFLDAIQGLGVFPLDVSRTPVDFLAADGHKWLLGPEGAGLLYIRRSHLDSLRPIGVGWNSVTGRHDFQHVKLELRPTAARYEGGSANMIGFHGLTTSLRLLQCLGAGPQHSAVATRVLAVTDEACQMLQSAGANVLSCREPTAASGIVLFDVPGCQPADVRAACLAAGVVVSCRGRGVRLSAHAYNDTRDLERLCQVVRQLP